MKKIFCVLVVGVILFILVLVMVVDVKIYGCVYVFLDYLDDGVDYNEVGFFLNLLCLGFKVE